MAGRTRKVKALRFRNFPTQWRGYAFFVEQGYNEQLNLSIINHLEEIRKLLWKESINFIYFPYLMHEIRDAAVYNFPQMTKGWATHHLSRHLRQAGKPCASICREDSPEHRCLDQPPLQFHQ